MSKNATEGNVVLQIDNLESYYGHIMAIRGVSLRVNEGQIVTVLGANGAGKTTLLKTISGVMDPEKGTVKLEGSEIQSMEADTIVRRGIVHVPEGREIFPLMTVAENITFPLQLSGLSKAEQQTHLHRAAEMLNLGDYLTRKPRDLSGGQRQRVAMGRAIVRDPAVFLFDEPLSNLDAKLRVQMRSDIKKLQQELGKTAIYVTHDQVEAMTMADRILLMNDGRIEQIGKPMDLYDTPASAYAAEFVGSPAINLIKGEITVGTPPRFKTEGVQLELSAEHQNAGIVTLGIRPEDVSISPGPGDASGVVCAIESTGDRTVVDVQVGQAVIRTSSTDRVSLEDKATVALKFSQDKIHVFNTAGKRVEAR